MNPKNPIKRQQHVKRALSFNYHPEKFLDGMAFRARLKERSIYPHLLNIKK